MRLLCFKSLILSVFLIGSLFKATAQTSVNLIITKTNGEEQSLLLSDQSQLHFEDGETLVIDDGNGSTQTIQLSQIRKMVCTEILDTEELGVSTVRLFPNPSSGSFFIKGLDGTSSARIFALDGRLVMTFEAHDGSVIDISGLSEGMYLLNINGQTQKLMKL